MEGASPQGVGRISHAIFESRDLDRTAAFYNRYCGLDRMVSASIPGDTMVLPLVAGARLIFKQVDQLQLRTGGSTKWAGVHNAFIVRHDEFMSAYEKIWNELDEWDYDQRAQGPMAWPGGEDQAGAQAQQRQCRRQRGRRDDAP